MNSKLPTLAEELCREAVEINLAWFGAVNERVQDYTLPDGYAEVGGEAALAMGAWLVMNLLQYAETKSSLSLSERQQLAALLSAHLFGEEKDKGWEMMGLWVKADAGDMVFNFASRVAKHITGDTHPLEATVEISGCVSALTSANLIMAESVFAKHGLKRKRWFFF